MTVVAKAILQNPIHCAAFGFGSGLAPKAPGTFGMLAAIPLYLLMVGLSLPFYAVLLIASFVLGVYLCDKTSADLGVHDHPGIVWDEFVGFWLTMFMAPAGWQWIVIGFVLFRLFDIWKPWPIRQLDRNVDGGLGIMVDDVLAAVYAWLGLQLLAWLTGNSLIVPL